MFSKRFSKGDVRNAVSALRAGKEVDSRISALVEYLTPIEIEIVCALDNAAVSADDLIPYNKAECTKFVLQGLRDLGTTLGYDVRAGWLYDFVWFIRRQRPWLPVVGFINGTQWGDFEGLKLACESEWNGAANDVLEDFAKLTVAKAELRLFVHSNQSYTADLCKSIIPLSCGARYLFVGFDKPPKSEFRVDALVA